MPRLLCCSLGAHFTCFTGTKLQMLTQKALPACGRRPTTLATSCFPCFTGTKVQILTLEGAGSVWETANYTGDKLLGNYTPSLGELRASSCGKRYRSEMLDVGKASQFTCFTARQAPAAPLLPPDPPPPPSERDNPPPLRPHAPSASLRLPLAAPALVYVFLNRGYVEH
jgi:hypothetical protein